MEPIHLRIAKNLQRIRKNRGLSLDKTAELTGVSKAMLGQIERGESNPTVTTLWKIATGLNVSFSCFIEEEASPVTVVSLDRIEPLAEEAGAYKVYPLFPFDRAKRFEIFTVLLEPGCSHRSEAHQPGVEEYVIVAEGELQLDIDEQTYTVGPGNAIRFPADRPHVYRNRTESRTRIQVLIYYP
ncbi:helix-turn-helix domain-containing protein [Effusibacillus pohliae]|uniref:helix-turn-helix domain-containing protein n=1 Tax=Effusibacillus pohliae TaxID=232270 RepID=UPI000382A465|nr:XRE family transcriptional regulator [Effusibacillus pohliae]